MADNNSVIIDKVFKGTNAYQLGAPNPTQVGIAKSMRWINDPMNSEWRMKTFIPQLFALIGTQIVHSKEWTNPLAQFKRANISNMKAIEEIMARLIKGRTYMQEMQGNLLEYNPPEVETAIHTVNRKVQYPITYNPQELENAFLSEQGLSNFFTAVMQVPINSDNRDEYEMMKDLIAKYQDKWGFYMVSVSEHSPEEATKDDIMTLLENIRAYADKLKFYTGLYNAYKMEVFTPKDQLLVMMTPEVKAKMDVQALAAAFNVAFAEIESRIILVDEMPIPDCYALLMDENWFVCGDALLQTTNFFNGATLNTNYWLHHWEVLSMSPMMNAIAFMKDSATQVETVTVTPRSYSVQHRVSSSPFRQDGTTDSLIADTTDQIGGTKPSNDYISYDEEVAPQRYHNLNGLLFFDANPNLPDLPIEEWNGQYVFKPSTFTKGMIYGTAYTVNDNNEDLPKWKYERVCDCYDEVGEGEVLIKNLIDYSMDEKTKSFAAKAADLIPLLFDNISNKQYDNVRNNIAIQETINFKLAKGTYGGNFSKNVKFTIQFTDTDEITITAPIAGFNCLTTYSYDGTTHTLGSKTNDGLINITIPDGSAFETALGYGESDQYVGVFFCDLVGDRNALMYNPYIIGDTVQIPAVSQDICNVTVDDFGRLQINGDINEAINTIKTYLASLGSLYIAEIKILPLTGTTTYKSDGFDTDYLNNSINEIELVGPETLIYDCMMNLFGTNVL